MLEARDIGVRYGGRVALAGVSLRLAPGELTAVVGPNGAGKSTLLRALNGAVEISSGEVMLDGAPLRALARRTIARRVAVVAQEAELRFPVTVLEYVLGGRFAWAHASAWGWETADDLRAARAALRETDLWDYAARRMDELSGGERQRAVLARALATGAGNLLLDEPTANLDLAHQASLLSLVRARCDRAGAAALVVTHDLNLAAEYADSIVLVKAGRVVAAGPPREALTPQILEGVFEVEVLVDAHPLTGAPRITPVRPRAGR